MVALTNLGLVEFNATFVFMIINVIILYVFLKKKFFEPVNAFMDKRSKAIADSITDAEQKLKEAEEYKSTYAEKLNKADEEGKQIVDKAVTTANQKADSIVKEAKEEASHIKNKAEKDIELERKKALNEVKNEISTLAILAASKIIETEIDAEKNEALVEKFIEEVGEVKWQN